ncbi:MAG: hypothetical protein CM15mP60_2410 [Alphaproteobacteria bacterium]|nr:MAG: hypothetical protein CM15mP60_2410 [Alphaproteobacteria bacterium]
MACRAGDRSSGRVLRGAGHPGPTQRFSIDDALDKRDMLRDQAARMGFLFFAGNGPRGPFSFPPRRVGAPSSKNAQKPEPQKGKVANWSQRIGGGFSSSGLSCSLPSPLVHSATHIFHQRTPFCVPPKYCRGVNPPPPSGRVPVSSAATICHRRWSPPRGPKPVDLAGVKRAAEMLPRSSRDTAPSKGYEGVRAIGGDKARRPFPRSEIRRALQPQDQLILSPKSKSPPGNGPPLTSFCRERENRDEGCPSHARQGADRL